MLSDGFVWKQTLVCLVRNMCQDRNFGLLKWREKIHAGDFLCQQGQFSASQTQDSFKQKHKSFEIHLLCLDSLSLEYSECYKFNYNCRGKKPINFPTFYMIVRMITLLCTVSLSVIVFQHCMAMEARVTLWFPHQVICMILTPSEGDSKDVYTHAALSRLHIMHVDAVAW